MFLTTSIDASTVITILMLSVLVVIISLNLYLRSAKKNQTEKKVSLAYIEVLKEALGIDNLVSVKIEHERVKFLIKDIKRADLKLLKGFSKEGVFVKSKEITMTFDQNPKEIKRLIERGIEDGKNI
jgi:phosphotransferase system IIB component